MEFRILGPLEVVDRGHTLALGGPKPRALLAALLLTPNRAVSVDRLIEVLWPTGSPAAAANALQFHVSQLRKLLGDSGVLVTQEPGYLIRVEPDQLDLLRFERLVAEAVGAEAARAGRLLREALGLWRGEPLPDLADDATSQAEIQRLEAARLAALELRIEADLALGHYAQLVPELEALVRENPLHERLAGALMQALYGAGRQAEALEVYRTVRETFVAELGIEPSPALRELESAILRHDLELAPDPQAAALRAIVVLAGDEHRLGDLLAIAEPLANRPRRELILARFMADHHDLAAGTTVLADATRLARGARGAMPRRRVHHLRARSRGGPARGGAARRPRPRGGTAGAARSGPAQTSHSPTSSSRLPARSDSSRREQARPADPSSPRSEAPNTTGPRSSSPPGSRRRSTRSLRLLGTEADPAHGQRDASRLLARASLLVQQVVGIVTEPVLIPPGDKGVVQAAAGARLLVIGLSDRWHTEGIGSTRLAIATATDTPVLFVRHGSRPAGLGPPGTLTRFTWTRGSGPAGASS